MDDYIKREDAIKALGEEPYVWSDTDTEIAEHAQWVSDVKAIEAVPSADVVERKTGKWIDYKCSECEEPGPILKVMLRGEVMWERDQKPNFCINCGAKMESEEENDK